MHSLYFSDFYRSDLWKTTYSAVFVWLGKFLQVIFAINADKINFCNFYTWVLSHFSDFFRLKWYIFIILLFIIIKIIITGHTGLYAFYKKWYSVCEQLPHIVEVSFHYAGCFIYNTIIVKTYLPFLCVFLKFFVWFCGFF